MTPTPGDLSARLPELPEAACRFDPWPASQSGSDPLFTADQMRAYAIAALSALPAAGGERTPDGYHYVYVDPFGSGEEVIVHNSGGEWNGQKPRHALPYYYTTPQPSAAEGCCLTFPCVRSGAVNGACVMEAPPPDAAVGTQGDGDD